MSTKRLVIETKSQVHDAPYADSFLVISMFVIDEKDDGSCFLRVWWGVRFLKVHFMNAQRLSQGCASCLLLVFFVFFF